MLLYEHISSATLQTSLPGTLLPDSAMTGYNTEVTLFISVPLSLWLVTTLKWRSLCPCLCRYDWWQHWSDTLSPCLCRYDWLQHWSDTLYLRVSVAMIGYNTEVTLYISTPLSTDAVSTLPQVWLMIVVAEQLSQVAFFSEDLKCWGAWDTTCGYKTKDITPSIACRRDAWKEEALYDILWKDERGPSSIKRTLELLQRRHWGNFWETGWSAYGLFWAHRYHLELNWNEHSIEART